MTEHTSLNAAPSAHAPSLTERVQHIEALIRREPTEQQHRWSLVELLCVQGQWERALQQLQAWGKLAPQWQAQAHLVRGLIQAETQRTQVFAGTARPAPVTDMPPWMDQLASALQHNARGEHEQADTLRKQALEQAPTRPGVCVWHDNTHAPGHSVTHTQEQPDDVQPQETLQEQPYAWISDSDTRLGPVCEVIIAGAYRWLAFADVAHLQLPPPQRLLDLVWLPARLRVQGAPAGADGAPARDWHVFLPSRYCLAQGRSHTSGTEQALLLSHLTRWQDVGQTGVFAQGQKTWMSEGIDWPMLDVRELRA